MPYNPYLTKKYNAHINVEVCSSVKAIKYLFKYVYKGYDCANIEFKENTTGTLQWDEITAFLDARYVSAPEAMWRILEKEMHNKSHSIERLQVHLQDCQPIYFIDEEEQAALEKAQCKKTTLLAWFQLNKVDLSANKYLYTEIPKHYTFNKAKGEWKKRVQITKGDTVISRMYSASPKDSEKFHLRMLLNHVPGATSYEFLRTVDGIVHSTFKDACRAKGLLEDDAQWKKTLDDACQKQMPKQLRQLFGTILVFCRPTNPFDLWTQFKHHLYEDFLRDYSELDSENLALCEIQGFLSQHNTDLKNFELPEPIGNPVRQDPEKFDLLFEKRESEKFTAMLNQEQKKIFDEILTAYKSITDGRTPRNNAFCLSAPGGVGKSFVFNTLLHTIRGNGDVAIAVAWTGIAATLLKGGRTVHSRFKLPIPLLEHSSCHVKHGSLEADRLISAKVIIWDECTMAPKDALVAIDRLLKDLTKSTKPFAGKIIILGGDWRQGLPITFHSNKFMQLQNCLKNASLWPTVKQFTLEKNMRTNPDEQEFAEWLLKLGNGELLNDNELADDIIEIPQECVVKDSTQDPIGSLIQEVFGDSLENGDLNIICNTAILCPKNEDSLAINDRIVSMLPGEEVTYLSADTVLTTEDGFENNYPMEYINDLTPSGMPPHKLILKKGCIIMLLRNIDPTNGLCNGTRLIVKNLQPNFIDAEILNGQWAGERVFLSKMKLCPSDTANVPSKMQRIQFPIRVAFCMTITKSQGQSFKHKVGIYLPEVVFAHGQLYVAFSRAHSKSAVRVLVKNGDHQGKLIPRTNKIFTRNVVYKEIFMM